MIDVALERGTRKPRLHYPPTCFFWFSGPAFHEGTGPERGLEWVDTLEGAGELDDHHLPHAVR